VHRRSLHGLAAAPPKRLREPLPRVGRRALELDPELPLVELRQFVGIPRGDGRDESRALGQQRRRRHARRRVRPHGVGQVLRVEVAQPADGLRRLFMIRNYGIPRNKE
jgi:hypothetical protein